MKKEIVLKQIKYLWNSIGETFKNIFYFIKNKFYSNLQ